MRRDACTRRDWLALAGGIGIAAAHGFSSAAAAEEPRRFTIPSVERLRGSDPKHWKLADLINDLRRRQGLDAVPLSPRMSVVAILHARDLAQKRPHERFGSLHSWSEGGGDWKGGAYKQADKGTWPLMWEKPKEIAAYPGNGFEVAAAKCKNLEQALAAWLESAAHSAVILNRGIWEKMKWKALGAAFEEGYACAWFGEEQDAG